MREARASAPPLPPPQDCCSVLPMAPNCLLPDTGQALLPHLQPAPFSCISCQQFLQDLPTFSVTNCRGLVRYTYSHLTKIDVCVQKCNTSQIAATPRKIIHISPPFCTLLQECCCCAPIFVVVSFDNRKCL